MNNPPPPESDVSSPPPPPPSGSKPGGGRGKATSWMAHVKATMRAHKGLSLKQALRKAKLTYKKAKRGGAGFVTPSPIGSQEGGRRRKTRRSRRGSLFKLY